MTRIKFVIGELYHIFNRGTDKREIFTDKYDVYRFIQGLRMFNTIEPIGSIFVKKRANSSSPTTTISKLKDKKLVNIICYCLNMNHFHLILEENVKGGVSEIIRRLAGGYTRYYNEKYERSGVLFQGKYKAVHIESNEQLLHTSVYVNLNNKVHKKFSENVDKYFMDKIPNRSSWNEYIKKDTRFDFCKKDTVLGQFENNKSDYEKFAKNTLAIIKELKE